MSGTIAPVVPNSEKVKPRKFNTEVATQSEWLKLNQAALDRDLTPYRLVQQIVSAWLNGELVEASRT